MATKVRDYTKLASDIIQEVGGKDNIINATRCATRLRLVLKETADDAKDRVGKLPGVITVVENGGQFQVVIGNHVGDVYAQVAKELDLDNSDRVVEEPKQGVLNRVIATMSAVFAPFIYVLAAAGLLQGVLILINLAVPSFANTGTYEVLSFMSWAPFTFLPIFIAITASKHFQCNIYIAVLCCCALVSPTWTEMAARIADGETIKFLIFNLSETTYTSSVLPPLFLVWILSYLEHFVEKRLHENIKSLFTPLICLVIMVPLTILLIGPLSSLLATGIANGYNTLFNAFPALAAAVIGGVWQVIVIFGVHWGITPVVLANFDMYGRDSFQAFQTIAVVAQMAAAFGVFIKSRNKEFKGVALSSGITGIFGITEPAIYGVTLRLKKPFVCGCAAGAVGAIVASFFNSYYYAYAGLPGLLTTVNAINPENPTSFLGEAIGCAIAIIGAIILVQIVGFDDPKPEEEEEEALPEEKSSSTASGAQTHKEVYAPIKGEVIPLKEVEDEVFSSELMGKGAAIKPEEGKVYAPFDGTVESIFDTKHAMGLKSDDGVELLIHVGMDTVKLNGEPFELKTEAGKKISKGDLLLEFDMKKIEDAGLPLVTPVIVSNTDDYTDVLAYPNEKVEPGDALLSVIE